MDKTGPAGLSRTLPSTKMTILPMPVLTPNSTQLTYYFRLVSELD